MTDVVWFVVWLVWPGPSPEIFVSECADSWLNDGLPKKLNRSTLRGFSEGFVVLFRKFFEDDIDAARTFSEEVKDEGKLGEEVFGAGIGDI